ncbi:MAG: YczE/YyaS/YitT family protein [Coprococcus sp.]
MKNMKVRIPMYFVGLFIMTIGIALSVKSNLGVSPVSSIPYTMTCVWGIEMGKATIIFHAALVLIQILLLRKRFKPINLLQVVVGIVFGYFTTFCNYLATFLPSTDNIAMRIVLMLVSTVFIAVGIFFYLPANLIPLAGEGVMQAVSEVTKIEFSKVKIGFDCSMVIISVITCLICIHSLGSVGVGTVIAAFLVGFNLGRVNKAFGAKRDKLLGRRTYTEDEVLRERIDGTK